MQTIISGILLLIGSILMLLASIGVVRMPDVFLRMSASTKAATLGVILLMLAIAIHFNDLGVSTRALGIVIFIILTGPISAHMIARAAYIRGAHIWSETKIDELKGQYNLEANTLESRPCQTKTVD